MCLLLMAAPNGAGATECHESGMQLAGWRTAAAHPPPASSSLSPALLTSLPGSSPRPSCLQLRGEDFDGALLLPWLDAHTAPVAALSASTGARLCGRYSAMPESSLAVARGSLSSCGAAAQQAAAFLPLSHHPCRPAPAADGGSRRQPGSDAPGS